MAPLRPFENLVLPKKLLDVSSGQYRVYKTDGSIVKVKANTVQEALKESGEKEVIKIEREMLSSMHVIEAGQFAKSEPAPPPETDGQPQAATLPPEEVQQPTA